MKKLLLIPMLMFSSDPSDINERNTIEGAIINLNELSRWVTIDMHSEEISEETASMYYSLLEITILQLENINKQENDK
jgi:hypothetical protein